MLVSISEKRFLNEEIWGMIFLGKVRVSGPGIEHGVLSTFQSHFVCETKGAGKKTPKYFEFDTRRINLL